MLAKLFRPAPAKAPVASVPPGTRVYAIGDIHGRLDLLVDLQDQIRAHAAEYPVSRRVLVYIGDYIDRGYQSRQTLDHLLDSPVGGIQFHSSCRQPRAHPA